MPNEPPPVQNLLLANLPADEFVRLNPYFKPTALPRQTVIYEAGDLIDFIYFPSGGLIAEAAMLEDGQGLEILSVGREGALGICALSGMSVSAHELTVQITGAAWRIGTDELQLTLQNCPVLKDRLARYLNVWFLQTSQTALCTGRHSISQRLRRQADRCQQPLRQQPAFPDSMRRWQWRSESAGRVLPMRWRALEEDGIIRSGRGSIDIIDPARLKQNSCECSECRQQAYDRLLPDRRQKR